MPQDSGRALNSTSRLKRFDFMLKRKALPRANEFMLSPERVCICKHCLGGEHEFVNLNCCNML